MIRSIASLQIMVLLLLITSSRNNHSRQQQSNKKATQLDHKTQQSNSYFAANKLCKFSVFNEFAKLTPDLESNTIIIVFSYI